MKKTEFDEVVGALGVYNPTYIDTKKKQEVHEWNGLEILFSGSFFAIIKGKIPLTVAKSLNKPEYEKFSIRPNGMMNHPDPETIAIDDTYFHELVQISRKGLKIEDHIQEGKKAFQEFLERDEEEKYIPSYHIDTKEGFILFLVEMVNYLDSKTDAINPIFQK